MSEGNYILLFTWEWKSCPCFFPEKNYNVNRTQYQRTDGSCFCMIDPLLSYQQPNRLHEKNILHSYWLQQGWNFGLPPTWRAFAVYGYGRSRWTLWSGYGTRRHLWHLGDRWCYPFLSQRTCLTSWLFFSVWILRDHSLTEWFFFLYKSTVWLLGANQPNFHVLLSHPRRGWAGSYIKPSR